VAHHETDVTAAQNEFQLERGVVAATARTSSRTAAGRNGIVHGAQQQRRQPESPSE